ARLENLGQPTLVEVRQADPRRLMVQAAGRLHHQLQLLARLTERLQPQAAAEVDLLEHPDWLRFRSALLEALDPFPEARLAVADRLEVIQARQQETGPRPQPSTSAAGPIPLASCASWAWNPTPGRRTCCAPPRRRPSSSAPARPARAPSAPPSPSTRRSTAAAPSPSCSPPPS